MLSCFPWKLFNREIENGATLLNTIRQKKQLNKIHLTGTQGNVLLEGDLGEFIDSTIIEETLLEIRYINGVLRVDIKKTELDQLLKTEKVFQLD